MTDEVEAHLAQVLGCQSALEDAMTDDMDQIIVLTAKLMEQFAEDGQGMHIALGAMLQCILNSCVMMGESNDADPNIYAQALGSMLVSTMHNNKQHTAGVMQ